MTASDRWRELHERHFPDLPFDCGNISDPGVRYSEHLRDWSAKATTPDQRRIEAYIDRYDLRQKRILHIGIGNSGLARRFHRRVKEIVGTTIDEPEMSVARSLSLPNYGYVIHNKFGGEGDLIEGRFDFILDNNPTSPCCCIRHLADLFRFYSEKLSDGGQIVTDRQGLEWVPDGFNPRWSFDFDDLAKVGAAAGLVAFRMNRTIYVLSQSAPSAPGALSVSRHWLRRAWKLPGQIARNGPRELARISRKGIKRASVAVLSALPARNRPDKKL
ncbi:MAG TPA: hypothetical protein VF067_02920 [Sphingomicrobium sp.]